MIAPPRAWLYLPPADFSLFTRAWEFRRSRRIVVYAYKALTGAAIALLCFVACLFAARALDRVVLGADGRLPLAYVVGACLATYIVSKVQWHVEHWTDPTYAQTPGHINPLDVLFDGALALAWVIPFESLDVWPVHVCVLVLCFPWSSE